MKSPIKPLRLSSVSLLFICCGLLLFGCKTQTAIVVTVETRDITIPDQMDRIQVVVSSPYGMVEKNLVSGELSGQSAPYTITVVRTDASIKSVVVRVRGLKGSKNIGDSDDVEIAFKDGEIVRRTVVLNAVAGCEDKDGDNFFVGLGCSPDLLTDCDDGDDRVFPGAPERCNGKDDNCDELQLVDEDPDVTTAECPPRLGVCRDVPIVCVNGAWDCGEPPGYSETELCADRLDNNCNGTVNEGCACTPADEGFECGTDVGECEFGVTTCVGNVLECVGGVEPVIPERCDGLDDNCNGETDEDFSIGDSCVSGLGNCQVTGTFQCGDGEQICQPNTGITPQPQPELCNDLLFEDEDCDGLSNEADTADCLIQFIWADACMLHLELDVQGGGNTFIPCTGQVDIPLHAQPFVSLPSGVTTNWQLLLQNFHNGWSGTAQIRSGADLESELRVIPTQGTVINDPTNNLIFTGLLRLTLSQSNVPFARYNLPVKVTSCNFTQCPGGGGYECVDPGPNGSDDAECPGDITN